MPGPFDFAQSEHDKPSRNWHNNCGVFTRTAFGVPSVGDFDGDGAADAEDQWKSAKFKHPETDPTKIPRGVPVYWTGGTGDNGHAAVSRGDGTIWTTDLVRDGQVDVAPIADVARKWGLTLLGWTEDIGGVRVWTAPAPKPAPKPETLTRGPRIDWMIEVGEKALATTKSKRRQRIISSALTALRSIKQARK